MAQFGYLARETNVKTILEISPMKLSFLFNLIRKMMCLQYFMCYALFTSDSQNYVGCVPLPILPQYPHCLFSLCVKCFFITKLDLAEHFDPYSTRFIDTELILNLHRKSTIVMIIIMLVNT